MALENGGPLDDKLNPHTALMPVGEGRFTGLLVQGMNDISVILREFIPYLKQFIAERNEKEVVNGNDV